MDLKIDQSKCSENNIMALTSKRESIEYFAQLNIFSNLSFMLRLQNQLGSVTVWWFAKLSFLKQK